MSTTPRLTDLVLERYLLGEASAEERRAVDEALGHSHETRARLDAIEESNRDILIRYPPGPTAERIRARARRERSSWMPRLLVAVPALAAAAALFVAFEADDPAETGHTAGVEVTRAKGLQPTLFVHRQTEDGSERLDDGATAHEHDVLQLSYLAAGRDRGAILSIDGRGTLTLHHPTHPGGDTTLLPAGEAALPRAYELDDAPGFERFFFVTTPLDTRPVFDTAAVLEAAKQLARDLDRARTVPLPLSDAYEQTSVLIEKPGRQP